MSKILYKKVVKVGVDCFGSATERWFARLITAHFNKHPHDIEVADLPKLCVWAKLTAALYTDNQQQVEQFAQQIEALAKVNKRQTNIR